MRERPILKIWEGRDIPRTGRSRKNKRSAPGSFSISATALSLYNSFAPVGFRKPRQKEGMNKPNKCGQSLVRLLVFLTHTFRGNGLILKDVPDDPFADFHLTRSEASR